MNSGNLIFSKRWLPISVAFTVTIATTVFELIKETIFSGSLNPWQSHSIAIAYSAIISGLTAWYFAGKLREFLESTMREQHLMLNSELIAIAKVKDRVITWNNSTIERALGYDEGELIGASTRVIYPTQEAYETLGASGYPVVQSGGVYRIEMQHARKTGECMWVDFRGVMLNATTAYPDTGLSLMSFSAK